MIVKLIILPESYPEAHRANAGDIIAICPEDHVGGRVTRKTHLIVKVDLGPEVTTLAEARKLKVPHFATGELWHPSDDLPQPVKVGKRRYNLPVSTLLSVLSSLSIPIDWEKVKDPDIEYQPLEDRTLPFAQVVRDKVKAKMLVSKDLQDMQSVDELGKVKTVEIL